MYLIKENVIWILNGQFESKGLKHDVKVINGCIWTYKTIKSVEYEHNALNSCIKILF